MSLLADWATVVGTGLALIGMVSAFTRWWLENRLFEISAQIDKNGLIDTTVRTRTDKAIELSALSVICYRGRFWRFWRWAVGQPSSRGHLAIPGLRHHTKLPISFDKAKTEKVYSTLPLGSAHKLPPIDPGVPGEPRRVVEPDDLYVLVSIAGRTVVRPVRRVDGTIMTSPEIAERTRAAEAHAD